MNSDYTIKKSQDKYISFTLDDFKPNGYDFDEERINQFLTIFAKESIINRNYLNKLYDDKGLFPEVFNLENEFYKLYNHTRLILIEELDHSNDISNELTITYAQLLLNRYIFSCFAEDKDLLSDETITNTILILIRNNNLVISTIWNRLNELFYFINHGNQNKDISAYNGGLFKEDINIKWSFSRTRTHHRP